MIRDIIAGVVGIVVAGLLIILIEKFGHAVYPPPPNLDFSDPEAMRRYMATLPFGAFLLLMAAWLVGTFSGTLIACTIGTAKPAIYALAVGGLVFAGTIANLIMIPHPLWFSLVSLAGIIASALLAMHLAPKRQASETSTE